MNYKKGITGRRFNFRRIDNQLLLDVINGRDHLPVATQNALTVPGKTFIGGVRVRRFTGYGIEIGPHYRVDLTRGLLKV